jgi:thiol-disulfide isomerase/thioredoxin
MDKSRGSLFKTLRLVLALGIILAVTRGLWCQQLQEIPANALKRGDHAPPLALELVLQGPAPADVNWKALHGKVVVLDFWGTWCPPCVADIPHLNALSSYYRGKPVQFIAVGHENPRKVAWFLKKHPIDAWIALDTDLSVYKDYSAFGIPHAVVVDGNGVVAAVLNPKELTEPVIDAVLNGTVPVYLPLTAEAYWNPDTAAEYFLKVGREEPPAK